jgi:hypothetical protein
MHFSQQDARQAVRAADFRELLLTPLYFSLMTLWGLRQWPHILANEALSCLDRRAEFVDTTDSGHLRASLSAVSLTHFFTDLPLLQISPSKWFLQSYLYYVGHCALLAAVCE